MKAIIAAIAIMAFALLPFHTYLGLGLGIIGLVILAVFPGAGDNQSPSNNV
jgi:hypothetical protein